MKNSVFIASFTLCFFSLWSTSAQKVNFKTQIWPIVQKKCLDCHNDQNKHPLKKKPKSGLQMDTPEMIMKGGGNGPIIIPGKPKESSMYTLAALPDDHEDVMPPKGELLSKKELETLRLWIEQGADFGVKLKKYEAPAKKESELNIYDYVSKKTAKPDAVAVKHFERRKFFIQPVQEGNNLLRIDFLAMKNLQKSDFDNIKKLKQQIVYLNFARTNIQDRDLVSIAQCKNLIILHLEKTNISDKGLSSLANLKSLEYLNLYGTKVSDKGIRALAGLKNLKKLFLWQTKVSASGAKALKLKNPKLVINMGD